MRNAAILTLAVAAVVFAACGGDDDSSTTTTTSTESSTTSDTDTTLPGEDIESVPKEGDVVGVVAVAHDDQLNVRAVPGTDHEVVATAAPTADDLVATGRARLLPGSIWYEVKVGSAIGWVNSRFVAFVDGTDDMTAEYLDEHPRPEADTMVELGRLVAVDVGTVEPESRIVQTVEATVGDLGEVTYDVIGIGDDATAGFRLHVFGMAHDSGGGFALRTIERTTFCYRGLSGASCV